MSIYIEHYRALPNEIDKVMIGLGNCYDKDDFWFKRRLSMQKFYAINFMTSGFPLIEAEKIGHRFAKEQIDNEKSMIKVIDEYFT